MPRPSPPSQPLGFTPLQSRPADGPRSGRWRCSCCSELEFFVFCAQELEHLWFGVRRHIGAELTSKPLWGREGILLGTANVLRKVLLGVAGFWEQVFGVEFAKEVGGAHGSCDMPRLYGLDF